MIIRAIESAEIAELSVLERQIWPLNLQATPEQLEVRARAFPEGIVGAWVREQFVAFATSQIVRFSPSSDIEALIQFLPSQHRNVSCHNPAGNTLHLMSGGVLPAFRRKGIWTLLIHYRIALAKLLGLDYVIVDSRMPSYAKRPPAFSLLTASQYAMLTKDRVPVDEYLARFSRLGFSLLGPAPSGFPDSESGDCWVFMSRKC